MSARMTWRKGRGSIGRMRLANNYELCRADEQLATVQELGDGRWFWYGLGMNTANAPTDLETAKKNAKAYVILKEASK